MHLENISKKSLLSISMYNIMYIIYNVIIMYIVYNVIIKKEKHNEIIMYRRIYFQVNFTTKFVSILY